MAGYTLLETADIAELLSFYDLGCVMQSNPMEGGQANSSYKINTDRGIFILSVCDEKNKDEVAYLTSILSHLNKHGFPTSRPVAARDGSFLIEHENKPVYVKHYVVGEMVRDLSQEMLVQLGAVVSVLHSIPPVTNMPTLFPYGLETFTELTGIAHPYCSWLNERRDFLQQAIDPDMRKGLIHGDIYWDNLLFLNNKLTAVLDFEEACYYYTLYDLGVCVIGCCSGHQGLETAKVQALLRGYQQQNRLTDHERAQLKVFIEYAGVAGSYWRFRQYNVRYPSHALKDSYGELASLADQVHAMSDEEFLAYSER